RGFDSRFLPTLGRPHAVALHFVRCGQLTAGLSPTRLRPCWAHIKKAPAERGPFQSIKANSKGAYSMILATTPAPTVRPPSRIAKRRPSSIAMVLIRVTVI
ncbi:hypothetical protein EKG40_30375, partial [Pseudomonas moorei]